MIVCKSSLDLSVQRLFDLRGQTHLRDVVLRYPTFEIIFDGRTELSMSLPHELHVISCTEFTVFQIVSVAMISAVCLQQRLDDAL